MGAQALLPAGLPAGRPAGLPAGRLAVYQMRPKRIDSYRQDHDTTRSGATRIFRGALASIPGQFRLPPSSQPSI